MKKAIVILAVFLGYAVTGLAGISPTTSTLEAIGQLNLAEAHRHPSVSFEATVTSFRSYENLLFVQDGGVAIYVNATTDLKLRPGDRILVRGTVHESFRNYVQSNDITLLRHGSLPTPVSASYSEMIRGLVDCRLVRVRAVVRSAEIVPSSRLLLPAIALRLLVEGEQVDAEVGGNDAAALKNLLDADVEITGVASGHFDNKMQQTGVLFHVQSLADIRILRRSDVDPWSLPATAMDRVITGYRIVDQTERMRVHGTITYYHPGTGLVLQDGAKSLWITTDSFQPLRIGDLADAIGFPDAKNGFLSLTRSEVRDRSILAPVVAPLYTWRDLAEGGNSSRGHMYDLVSIQGRVVAEVRQATQDEYVMAIDGHLTSAIFRHPGSLTRTPLAPMKAVPVGSQVRVTGICMLADADPFLGDVPFNILLRSFDDIAVVAPPPWLSVRHLVVLIAVMVAAMFSVVAWSLRIERRVRRQTAKMASIEHRRGRILEAMNTNRSLDGILQEITELVSFQLDGAPCWCELINETRGGNQPDSALRAGQVYPITAASGTVLGNLVFLPDKSGAEALDALSRGAGLIALAIEKSRLHSDLVHRSEFDLLTDIHNRFSIERQIDALIETADASPGVFGLIYIDLDEFKAVNDKYGHRTGDRYLQQVASRMRRQLRPDDLLARLGGDEFAVLAPNVGSRTDAEQIALRLERCFDDPFAVDETLIPGAASMGVALYPADGTSRDGLLNAADAAMYTKKKVRRELCQALATNGEQHLEPVDSKT